MAADISKLEIPVPSGSCKRAIEILSGNDADIKSLETAIAGDEILSNAVIKYSNSPVHHRELEISELGTATNILGLRNVYIVLLTAVLKEYMQESITGDRILQHCMTISALCSLIAARVSKQQQHEMELLGLIHDLPSLVLCRNYRAEYRSLIKGITHASLPLEQLEQEIFHFSRRELADASMRELALPEKMRTTLIAYHSITKPEQVEQDKYHAILGLAHHMEASVVSAKLRLTDSLPGEKDKLLTTLGLSDADYSDMINASRTVINEHIALVA